LLRFLEEIGIGGELLRPIGGHLLGEGGGGFV